MTIEFGVARGIDCQAFGQPGQRTFRLRVVGAEAQSASLWMEKEQMQALSLAIKQMLGQLEYNQEPPPPDVGEFPNVAEHDFRVGRMGMGFNPSDRTVVLYTYELGVEDEEPHLRIERRTDLVRRILEPHISSESRETLSRDVVDECRGIFDSDSFA